MSSFEFNRLAELAPFLNGEQGQAFARAMGGAQDAELFLLRAAALSRLPARCPDDALDAVGKWLAVERFDGEPDGTETSGYRGRLCIAWTSWTLAGSALAIEESLRAYGIGDVHVYQDFDGTFAPGSWYSRFWVVIGPDMPYRGLTLGNGPPLGTWVLGQGTLGSTASVAEVRAVKRQILKWKAAHSYPVRIILDFGTGTVLGVNWVLGSTSMLPGAVAEWHLGKMFGVDTSMPFVMGGYEL